MKRARRHGKSSKKADRKILAGTKSGDETELNSIKEEMKKY